MMRKSWPILEVSLAVDSNVKLLDRVILRIYFLNFLGLIADRVILRIYFMS